ncbi:MAG: hypothetical protein HYY01_13355 [Chloroflexi bacterium]|nr:hypothetical protein [Chloroflexota bacterium]
MSKIHIATRGPCNWRERLGDPETHWKRKASAMETAVSWERAARSHAGLPEPILRLFKNSELGESELLLAVAEHKVPLRGTGGDSQCDVWALIKIAVGCVSLAVEAKAAEPFGSGNETLEAWMKSGESPGSEPNRKKRWGHIQENLPQAEAGAYRDVPYQILQRCAAAVIEARRFGLKHAAFVVQSFGSPAKSFDLFGGFCKAAKIPAERDRMNFVQVAEVRLGIGWADCSFASDAEMASVL